MREYFSAWVSREIVSEVLGRNFAFSAASLGPIHARFRKDGVALPTSLDEYVAKVTEALRGDDGVKLATEAVAAGVLPRPPPAMSPHTTSRRCLPPSPLCHSLGSGSTRVNS